MSAPFSPRPGRIRKEAWTDARDHFMKQVELYRDGLTKVYEEDRQKLRMKSFEYQELVFTRLKDLVTGLNTICSKHFVSEVETNRGIRQAFLDAFGDVSQSTRLDASRALSQSESTGDKGKEGHLTGLQAGPSLLIAEFTVITTKSNNLV